MHAQDSCACTTLLCMHNTLVHALEGPGPKAGTQEKAAAGPARGGCFFVGSRPWALEGPRILCMHKNLGPKNKPLLLGRCAASGGSCFRKKRASKQIIMHNYDKTLTFICFSKKTFAVNHSAASCGFFWTKNISKSNNANVSENRCIVFL